MGKRVGGLYAINTWGAVAGCFLSGFVFLPNLGISTTLYVAAAVNLAIGIIGLIVSGRLEPPQVERSKDEAPDLARVPKQAVADVSPLVSGLLWFSVFASGLSVLALEVIALVEQGFLPPGPAAETVGDPRHGLHAPAAPLEPGSVVGGLSRMGRLDRDGIQLSPCLPVPSDAYGPTGLDDVSNDPTRSRTSGLATSSPRLSAWADPSPSRHGGWRIGP